MPRFVKNTGIGSVQVNQCAKELGLKGSQVHGDAANLADRYANQSQAPLGIADPSNPALFSPGLAHNGSVDSTHREGMDKMIDCTLKKHGYGDDMVDVFQEMYSDAILHDNFSHRMGNARH